ncbi:MAG: hypothetical protein ACYCYO_02050 [Bacilli bacterium]
MPNVPNKATLYPNENGVLTQHGLVYKDASGALAHLVTPLVVTQSGLLLFAPTDVSGNPQTSLTGTVPPLDSITPKLLATIPYSQFTAVSSSIYPYWVSVLTRSARARTFMVYNTMNQPLTGNSLEFYDSILGIGGQPGIAQSAVFTAAGSNALSTVTSESASASSQGLVASHVDSLQATLGIGATLPTSGNVQIWVSELL